MNHNPASKKAKLDELGEFDRLFPELVECLNDGCLKEKQLQKVLDWFKEVSEYNVPHGKKNRGLSVIVSLKCLKETISEEEEKIARILGWCVEWLQAFFLVADDVMDSSVTRRGKPCWYRREEVGIVAVNDAFYLESCVYHILRKYCKDKPYYISIVDLFHETTMQTVRGQCLDMITAPSGGKVDFTDFTEDRYNTIVKWKTGYYSFYLPVAIAMYMSGITDEDSHERAQHILLHMGRYFQIQDDFLDCYGDPVVIGKIGTDISENKCSWLVIQALKKSTPSQRRLLEENYADTNPKKVQRVKDLYRELELKDLYHEYEEESYKELIALIENHRGSLPESVFLTFAKKIYKRDR
ncbi:farnesyl pyrophosphate synthase-like [Ostrea edulis]|uniref:farnesyl pyrophosphate synthase-like n=1 Tax=Ostrea edulis TaxID=37623 RepID=UPI002095A1B4|nr:farnesyl pyrophosphate synthase-like [Ostrea edulis]XP_048728935.1 farnesyl pyrophosphate synthase-like [Ostrea edulis]XP_055996773.1 farnesyl pyrophosphate synthase-like [Ostrea edulis]